MDDLLIKISNDVAVIKEGQQHYSEKLEKVSISQDAMWKKFDELKDCVWNLKLKVVKISLIVSAIVFVSGIIASNLIKRVL